MNTDREMETKNLILRPSLNIRDSESFCYMLKNDGDFRAFCGVDYSDEQLLHFSNYFEVKNSCLYSVFSKEIPGEFIGYVGLGYQNERFELEFYVAKKYRGNGYCAEASDVFIKELFERGVSMDGRLLKLDSIYATTIKDNISAIKTLEKIGFVRRTEGPVPFASVFVNPAEEVLYTNIINEYVLKKPNLIQTVL